MAHELSIIFTTEYSLALSWKAQGIWNVAHTHTHTLKSIVDGLVTVLNLKLTGS